MLLPLLPHLNSLLDVSSFQMFLFKQCLILQVRRAPRQCHCSSQKYSCQMQFQKYAVAKVTINRKLKSDLKLGHKGGEPTKVTIITVNEHACVCVCVI